MRLDQQFPDGFGMDPSMLVGAGPRMEGFVSARQPEEPQPTAAVAGLPLYSPQAYAPSPQGVHLSREGLHLDTGGHEDALSGGREPQSVMVTTALVGIALAVAGYFFDFH